MCSNIYIFSHTGDGSEIWGAYTNIDQNKWESTPIEKLHTQLIKRILGVNRSTTNILVRGEVDRHSLQANILNQNINYMKYVENKCNTTLVKQALNYEQTKMECRPTILCLLKNHEKGLSTHPKNKEVINNLSKYKLRRSIFEEFNVLWQLQIPKFPKANTYKLFKTRVKLENYLIDNNNRKHRVAFTKLRLSDHNLMIEKGRHRRPITPREYRFCPHYPLQKCTS